MVARFSASQCAGYFTIRGDLIKVSAVMLVLHRAGGGGGWLAAAGPLLVRLTDFSFVKLSDRRPLRTRLQLAHYCSTIALVHVCNSNGFGARGHRIVIVSMNEYTYALSRIYQRA
jgi:hypothetical protein